MIQVQIPALLLDSVALGMFLDSDPHFPHITGGNNEIYS